MERSRRENGIWKRGYWEFKKITQGMGNARGHAIPDRTRKDGEARSGWSPRGAKIQANEDLAAFECTRKRG